MVYAYMDESGVPGVIMEGEEYFLVSVILVPDKTKTTEIERRVAELRVKMRLSADYEFHYARNSLKPQRAFKDLISRFDFKIITVAIRKSERKAKASHKVMARHLAEELKSLDDSVKLKMDRNPALYAELKRQAKLVGLKLSVREQNSRSEDLLQVADYVAALSMRKLKSVSGAGIAYDSILGNKELLFAAY